MRERSSIVQDRLHTPRCVACGYDGLLARQQRPTHCPHCGCDFRLRPSRSYAEMEGLLSAPAPIKVNAGAPTGLTERWLAFVFLLMLGCVAIVAICAELLAARG